MSSSFCTTAIYGVVLPSGFGKSSIPNPEYNPETPFNPKTGRPVPPTIDQDLDIEAEARGFGLDAASTTDGTETVVGIAARRVDIGEVDNSEISRLTQARFTAGLPSLAAFCLKHGFPEDSVVFCAVGHCSY